MGNKDVTTIAGINDDTGKSLIELGYKKVLCFYSYVQMKS